MVIWLIISFVILQRIVELFFAKRNERWMKARGAKEYGQDHYKAMVLIHTLFFLSLITEVLLLKKTVSSLWPTFIFLFIAAQMARIWVITSLGKYWNTKIIVLPGIEVVAKGPFKYVKHPNYLIVTIELLVIPLLFGAYVTAIVFFILNQIILRVRIPVEEKALRENTNYGNHFR